MSTIRLAAVGTLLLLSAASCSLPARDNPNDPALKPVASLAVTVRESVDESPIAGTSGSRHTLFTFDASGSRNPHSGADLTYAWDLDGAEGFEIAAGAASILADRRLTLSSAMLPAGIGAAARTATVRVTDTGTGAFADASVALSLSNQAPIVDLGEELVVPPFRSQTVTLDGCGGGPICTTVDPDGDTAFTWKWESLDGIPLTLVGGTSARATFTAPADPAVLVFRGTASDGLAERSALLTVRVGSSVWAETVSPYRSLRVHPEFLTWRASGAGSELSSVVPTIDESNGDVWRVELLNNMGLPVSATLEHRTPDMQAVRQSWTISAAGYSEVKRLQPRGDDACGFGTAGIYWFSADGSQDSAAFADEMGEDTALHPDPLDPAACLIVGATHVWRFGETLTPVSIGDVEAPHATALGTTDPPVLWLIDQCAPNPPLGGPACERLLRLPLDGTTTTPTEMELDGRRVDNVLEHPDGGVWVHDASLETPVLLHATDPLGGNAPRLTNGPEIYTHGYRELLLSDPRTRTLWVFDVDGYRTLKFVDEDGDLQPAGTLDESLFPFDELTQTTAILSVDHVRSRLLLIVYLDDGVSPFVGHLLALVPESLERSKILPPTDAYGVTHPVRVDPSRGSAWRTTQGFVARVASSGREILRVPLPNPDDSLPEVTAVDEDGTAWITREDAPGGNALTPLRISTDGAITEPLSDDVFGLDVESGTVCAIGPAGAWRINPDGSIETLDAALSGFGDGIAAASQGACWFVDATSGCAPAAIYFVPPGSTTATDLLFPLTECALDIAADPRGGSAWVQTDQTEIRHIDDAGALLDTVTVPAFQAFDVEALCSDGDDDACVNLWLIRPDAVVRARADGTEIDRFVTLGYGAFFGIDVRP